MGGERRKDLKDPKDNKDAKDKGRKSAGSSLRSLVSLRSFPAPGNAPVLQRVEQPQLAARAPGC